MNLPDIKEIIRKGSVAENEPMKLHTTFRAGGPAKVYVIPADETELCELIRYLNEEKERFYITGNGSNLLVSEQGYDGVVINIGRNEGTAFTNVRTVLYEDSGIITAGAGAFMSTLGREALEHGLTGFEPLSGIPGCVGGACIMNAGAYGGEMKDIIESCKAVTPDGVMKTFSAENLTFRYRGSSLSDDGMIIVSVCVKLQQGNKEAIKERMDDFASRRKEKQPLEYPSAGSTFKRPEGYFAGKLIEDAGLKGFSVGGASVSEKHAGFVINRGGTAEDIHTLIREIQKTVFEKFGVKLEPEVKMLGEF